MRKITVVDARMGRGKTSAAIRYMNQHKEDKKFLYITPYLSEVERICTCCAFIAPKQGGISKTNRLKHLMEEGQNIATTHVLFHMMHTDILAVAKQQGYSLIVDESIQMVTGVSVSKGDRNLIAKMITIDEYGGVTWQREDYEGVFESFKKMADQGTLFFRYGTFYNVVPPMRFCVFDEVIFLTYLFEGQIQKAYFDYFDFQCETIGITEDEEGFLFSDSPDNPPPIDFKPLVHLFGKEFYGKNQKVNDIGSSRTALSKTWYETRRRRGHPDMVTLRKNMNSFFNKYARCESKKRIWTTFKDHQKFLYGDKNRYKTSFLALNARATNTYKEATCVAYMVNRFLNPNVNKFFASKGIEIDQESYALSEMLQFIWRSAIRDGKEIWVYLPSKRMRGLLRKWLEETKEISSKNEKGIE